MLAYQKISRDAKTERVPINRATSAINTSNKIRVNGFNGVEGFLSTPGKKTPTYKENVCGMLGLGVWGERARENNLMLLHSRYLKNNHLAASWW